jgi:hypothetical protein
MSSGRLMCNRNPLICVSSLMEALELSCLPIHLATRVGKYRELTARSGLVETPNKRIGRNSNTVVEPWFCSPVDEAEHRSHFEIERAALPSWICKPVGAANPASSASAQNGEKRRAPRHAAVRCMTGRVIGSPFFWVLFFGEAKKSTSTFRSKPEFKKREKTG